MSESSPNLSLEEIAREITSATAKMAEPSQLDKHQPVLVQANNLIKGGRGRAYLFTQKFGEVVEAFMERGSIRHVCEKTGLTRYTLIKHFFSNPEFCKLLRGANESIFLEATESLRDRNSTFLNKASQLAEEALDEMERLLNESDNEHIRLKVAENLLDRDPDQRATRTKRVESNQPTIKVDFNFLKLAAAAAKEIDDGHE